MPNTVNPVGECRVPNPDRRFLALFLYADGFLSVLWRTKHSLRIPVQTSEPVLGSPWAAVLSGSSAEEVSSTSSRWLRVSHYATLLFCVIGWVSVIAILRYLVRAMLNSSQEISGLQVHQNGTVKSLDRFLERAPDRAHCHLARCLDV